MKRVTHNPVDECRVILVLVCIVYLYVYAFQYFRSCTQSYIVSIYHVSYKVFVHKGLKFFPLYNNENEPTTRFTLSSEEKESVNDLDSSIG